MFNPWHAVFIQCFFFCSVLLKLLIITDVVWDAILQVELQQGF
jgi:hypothetical protein